MFSLDYEFESDASNAIKDLVEEEKFKNFSLRAKSIRDSELTDEDENDFKNI